MGSCPFYRLSLLEAFNLEVLPALDHLKFIIDYAERFHAGLKVDPRHPFYAHKRAYYLYDAIGVIALVTPSSLPFASPLIQVAAALAMGNAIVLKPSERTPLSALRIGELCMEAGFPAGLVNVVPALPKEVPNLVAHSKVDKAFLTGSVKAGRQVMVAAGAELRPVVLCLGGKHPSVVAGDADVDRAARGVVWGALANAGQNCGSIERVYVEESIASQFVDRVVEEVERVKVGSSLADEVDMGPLLSEEHRKEVHKQVTEAVKRGARLLRGGSVPEGPGFFYPPTRPTVRSPGAQPPPWRPGSRRLRPLRPMGKSQRLARRRAGARGRTARPPPGLRTGSTACKRVPGLAAAREWWIRPDRRRRSWPSFVEWA